MNGKVGEFVKKNVLIYTYFIRQKPATIRIISHQSKTACLKIYFTNVIVSCPAWSDKFQGLIQ